MRHEGHACDGECFEVRQSVKRYDINAMETCFLCDPCARKYGYSAKDLCEAKYQPWNMEDD